MTRKEFTSKVTEQLMASPRSALAGNGISAPVLKAISTRPDIMNKLATFLWSTVYFQKGAKGLKRAANMTIKGYRNFNELNKSARADVDAFVSGLTPEDAEKFSNEDNIVTILALPEQPSENMSTADAVATGKSVALPFMRAVRSEYKIPGGFYIVIMFGDSAIRPVESKKAEMKATVNKKKTEKRKPARIKAELQRKAKARLDRINAYRQKLQATAARTETELNQITRFGKSLGLDVDDPRAALLAMKEFDKANKANLRSLTADEKEMYADAVALMKKGNVKGAKAILKEIDNPAIRELVLGQTPESTEVARLAQLKKYRAALKDLNAKNTGLLQKIEAYTAAGDMVRVYEFRRMIKRNKAKAEQIKARINALSDMSLSSIRDKRKLLAQTHAAIEAALADGDSVSEALEKAIAELEPVTTPGERQQIKQQVISNVAQQIPMQYAVQQAIQNLPAQQTSDWHDDFHDLTLGDLAGDTNQRVRMAANQRIADILASL